ncbi:hypothetical protein HDZ31DRAFT_68058 [Schizophyllum fasciatum]
MLKIKAKLADSPQECRPFPIHKLPDELFDHVLSLSIPIELTDPRAGSGQTHRAYLKRSGARDFPRLLSQVCRKWRSLVRTNSTLWSHIYVCAIQIDGRRYYADEYELPLSLSRDQPLSLICDVANVSIVDILSSPPFAAHISRLRLLSIDILGYDLTIPVFPLFEEVETPALEVLRIHDVQNMHESWQNFQKQRWILYCAPVLTELTLNGFEQGYYYFSLGNVGVDSGIEWPQLTVLRLPNVPCCVYDLFAVITSTTRLRVLQCTVFNSPEDDDWRDPAFYVPDSGSEEEWSEDEDDDLDEEDRPEVLERRQRRYERRAREEAMMGPHLLANLEELYISVANVVDDDSEYAYDAYTNTSDERIAIVKFLDGLTTPSLRTLTVNARKGLAVSDVDSSDDVSWTEIDAQENGSEPFVVYPSLKDFVKRSGCAIRNLSLTRVYVSLPELFSILKVCCHLRSLHLKDPLRFMRSSLIHGLATRTDKQGRLLAPMLNRIVIECRRQSLHSGFTNSLVLDLVDARWPPGWNDGGVPAYVEVVHCPVQEKGMTMPTEVARERTRSRLAAARARKDLTLVIRELPQSPLVRLELAGWGKLSPRQLPSFMLEEVVESDSSGS